MTAQIITELLENKSFDLEYLEDNIKNGIFLFNNYIDMFIKRHLKKTLELPEYCNEFNRQLHKTKNEIYEDHYLVALKYALNKTGNKIEPELQKQFDSKYNNLKKEIANFENNYGLLKYDEYANDLFFIHYSIPEFFITHSFFHAQEDSFISKFNDFIVEFVMSEHQNVLLNDFVKFEIQKLIDGEKSGIFSLKLKIENWSKNFNNFNQFIRNLKSFLRYDVSRCVLLFFGMDVATRKKIAVYTFFNCSTFWHKDIYYLSEIFIQCGPDIHPTDLFMETPQSKYNNEFVHAFHIMGIKRSSDVHKLPLKLLHRHINEINLKDDSIYFVIQFFIYGMIRYNFRTHKLNKEVITNYKAKYIDSIEDENDRINTEIEFYANLILLASSYDIDLLDLQNYISNLKEFVSSISIETLKLSLLIAALYNNLKMINILLELKPILRENINKIVDPSGNNLLMLVCIGIHSSYDYQIIKFLLPYFKNTEYIDTQNNNGDTALMICSKQQAWKTCELSIESNSNLNIQNKYGHTALTTIEQF